MAFEQISWQWKENGDLVVVSKTDITSGMSKDVQTCRLVIPKHVADMMIVQAVKEGSADLAEPANIKKVTTTQWKRSNESRW